MYTSYCCDIDSDEARGCCPPWQVFRGANVKLGNWRQVTVQIKISKFCNKKAGHMCVVPATHTETCTVTACRTAKVRKGGDFFYGKSSNENHTEGL